MITMSVSNNVEMKVKSDRDTTGERKISIIDELYGALSYNMAAETRPWSNLNTRIRLKLTEELHVLHGGSVCHLCLRLRQKRPCRHFRQNGMELRTLRTLPGHVANLSYTFNNETLSKLFSRRSDRSTASNDETNTDTDTDAEDANIDPDLRNAKRRRQAEKKQKAKVDEDGYLRFSLPWSFTVSYGISMAEDRSKQINVRRMRYPYSFTQTMNFSGYLRIAEGWNISFTSGYDFNYHELSMTTASVSRDLHCFEMSCSVVLRPYSSVQLHLPRTCQRTGRRIEVG